MFSVPGGTVFGDEFGNYAAGYTTYGGFGRFGEFSTKRAGDIYEFGLHGTLDDPGSVEMINRGIFDY